MPRRYPPEFRRKVLDLIASGRSVDVASDLGVSGHTIYNWRNQDLVDRGERPGLRAPSSPSWRRPTGGSPSSRRSSPPPSERTTC
jgi:transposase-like protein